MTLLNVFILAMASLLSAHSGDSFQVGTYSGGECRVYEGHTVVESYPSGLRISVSRQNSGTEFVVESSDSLEVVRTKDSEFAYNSYEKWKITPVELTRGGVHGLRVDVTVNAGLPRVCWPKQ